MTITTMDEASPWLAAFLARQVDLKRYFAARVGEVEAEDLVQEACLRIATLPADTNINSLDAYIGRIGHNIMLDRIRQDRARARRDTEWYNVQGTFAPSGEKVHEAAPADDALIARERIRQMQEALGQLPEPVRQAFLLHKFDGLSHAEIAERLGVSRSSIEKHMMRALKHLMKRLGG